MTADGARTIVEPASEAPPALAPPPADGVRVIPLGGLGEIGMNMTLVETQEDLLVVDAGLMFPEEEMLGIDLVIPDTSALLARRERVRGIVLTHGHEDHTGALPFLLRALPAPVFGTTLTLGLASERLREAGLLPGADLRRVRAGEVLSLGQLQVEFIRVAHSIPDGVGLALHTPAGLVVHTGDFKFDPTPVDGQATDYGRFAALGDAGVQLLLSDSTNAVREGLTPSERVAGTALARVLAEARRRVIVACFASNLHRLQQILDAAARLGRRVAFNGKSMLANVRVASELGALQLPPGVVVELPELRRLPPERGVIVTTGSQGEPLSALARMAVGEHKQIEIQPGDVVVFSARVIPGNEKSIAHTINQLLRRGAEVITEEVAPVHVSGHASREELKLMLHLTRPRFLAPIHGEYRHLHQHARLAAGMGWPAERIVVLENGDALDVTPGLAKVVGRVTAGRVFVDGKGVGDVGEAVLRDRHHLAQDGLVLVVVAFDRRTGGVLAGPEIASRGFTLPEEASGLFEEARRLVLTVLEGCSAEEKGEWPLIKQRIRSVLKRFIRKAVDRRPMILPVIMEV
jgi:ribonuclease J